MNDTRKHPPSVDRSNPHVIVPAAQARALDRRQALDQQQRACKGPTCPAPHLFRKRPPS